jgi:hypothetical protein
MKSPKNGINDTFIQTDFLEGFLFLSFKELNRFFA